MKRIALVFISLIWVVSLCGIDNHNDLVINTQDYRSVPLEINYQGYLMDNDSTVNDTLNMEFKLYTQSTGGTQLWSESHSNVIIRNGIFNVILGSNNPFSASYFNGNPLWLETKIASQTLSPRKKIVTVSYAVRSFYSDTAVYAQSAPASPDNDWLLIGNILYPVQDWGLSMRQTNNLWGIYDSTHVCLGVNSTTGSNSSNYSYCTVGGGSSNSAVQDGATVGGGLSNIADEIYSTVAGGATNWAQGAYSAIGGGHENMVGNGTIFSTIGAGFMNVISTDSAVISGGVFNIIQPIAFGSNINGGSNNQCGGFFSTVAGGLYVLALAPQTFGWGHGSASDPVLIQNPNSIVFGDGTNIPYNFGINNENPAFPLHVGTNPTNGNGAFLSTGGVWTNGCSRTFKENFIPLKSDEILQKLIALPIYRYNYKGESEAITHISPVAEDFYQLFNTGSDPRYIAGIDMGGVAILAIQELAKQNQKINQTIDILNRENQQLSCRCEQLEQELESVKSEIQALRDDVQSIQQRGE